MSAGNKIKIFHLIKSLGRGGAETLLVETLKQHDRSLFEFSYGYFLPWKDHLVPDLEKERARVVCFRASNNVSMLMASRKVANWVQKNNIDIIHCHLPWAGLVGRMVSVWRKRPLLYTEHNLPERYHPATRFLNTSSYNLFTSVVAVSKAIHDSVIFHKPRIKVPLKVISNGVNIEHFNPANSLSFRDETRRRLHIPTQAIVVGIVAVFRTQKRMDLWIDVAARLADKYREVYFLVVGDGPLKNEIFAKRRALHLEKRMVMMGLQSDVYPMLAAMDIFMMTSAFEGVPIALLEAMSMQCAVVSTDAGGIKEVVRHEVDGLLCPVADSTRLIPLVERLLNEPCELNRLKQAARRRVIESFNILKMTKQLEDLYLQYSHGKSRLTKREAIVRH